MTLPENIDASYLDQSPGDAAHQQHHDEIHGKVNRIPAGTDPVLTETAGNAAYVNVSGGTMTGALTLSGAPTVDLHAATKAYVDSKGGPAFSGARVFHSVAQSIAGNGQWAVLAFDSERYDTDAYHDIATNNGRLHIPAGAATQRYLLTASARFAANSTGQRGIQLRINGTTSIAMDVRPATAAEATGMSIATEYQLSAGDYVEVLVFQGSGAALNIDSGANFSPEFTISARG